MIEAISPKHPEREKKLIWKNRFSERAGQMNDREMLEIIETRAWFPKKKPDKANLRARTME